MCTVATRLGLCSPGRAKEKVQIRFKSKSSSLLSGEKVLFTLKAYFPPITRSTATSHQPSGRRTDSPTPYTCSEGDAVFDFAVDDDGDNKFDEKEDMFEDAASSTAHGASAIRPSGSTQASR